MILISILLLKKLKGMNKTKLLIICVAALVVLNAGTLFYLFRTQKKEPQRQPEKGGPATYIIEQLKLTDQQQAEFKKLRDEHQGSVRPAREEDKKLHQAFFSLVKSGQAYGPEADSLVSLMAGQRKIMESATFAHFQKLRTLCTDQQKPKLDEIIDELAMRVGGQPGEGRPPGDRPEPPPGEGDHPGPPPPNGEQHGPNVGEHK